MLEPERPRLPALGFNPDDDQKALSKRQMIPDGLLEGAWKDTILVRKGYKIVVRTRYQRYIGEFVLHCHILDHEDQGMMQNISIVVPQPAAAQPRVNHRH
jgi:hypothetical protein